MGEPEDAVSYWESGWNRVKKFYDFENPEYDMERDIVLRTSRTAFLCGFFIGGISTSKESFDRFERYATGKKFLSKRDAFRRMGDYSIVMFAKNGFRMGLRATVLSSAVMLLTTHTTIFRDKFSAFYFPTFSGLSAFITHRALACGIFAFPVGIYGQMQALGLGLCTGTMLSGVSWLYALAIDKNFPDAYKQFKQEYVADMEERYAEEKKVKQLMKDENIKIRVLAYKRLHELEKEKMVEAAQKHDT